MARVVITCVGTRGDLLPYACVASRLRERGHRVTFAVERRFADWLRAEGFDCSITAGDLVRTLLHPSPRVLETTNAVRTIQLLVDDYLLPTLPERIRELRDACRRADLLISSPTQIASQFVADLTGIARASVALTPSTIPDPGFAPMPYSWPHSERARSVVNHLAWTYARRTIRRVVDAPINRRCTEFGLPSHRDLLYAGGVSHQLTAIAVSPAVLPANLKWPSFVKATGFCFWEDRAWSEPVGLPEFLARCTPVIAVSLGSVSPETGKLWAPLYEMSIAAIHRVGARALILGAPLEALPPLSGDDYALPYAPHGRIFPHCVAVIHHGGMGTAAQAWRAGIPALVVPGGFDQYVTAVLARERGVGQWLPRARYTAERAAGRLRSLLEDAALRRRADDLSRHIRQEDGAAQLVGEIERRFL